MQRLNRNHGGYHGERIDIDAVLQDCAQAARTAGWQTELINAGSGIELPAFQRRTVSAIEQGALRRVYLSTGIHGDEPAGPLAMQRLLSRGQWPSGIEIWVLPCLNPTGFRLNRRENSGEVDLNRDYRHLATPEVRAHVGWLECQPRFDVTLCLHEDWESHGFYVYELNPEDRPSLAPAIVEAVAEVCPIDRSEVIEGRAASGGIIRPNLDPATRPQWPEAFWLLQNKTRLSYTLEAPSDFPLETRVNALVTAVQAALGKLAG